VTAHHAMSNVDAAWLRMDRPTNQMVINSVLWFDEPVDWEQMRTVFAERIVEAFPRFRQRPVEPLPPRSPYWEDDPTFDLDLHIHRRALPPPGDQRALQELVGDLAATPLDRSKPLWQAYFVDGYGDGCAVITRIHHAVADGMALVRVLMCLTDESEAQPPASPQPHHSLPERAVRGIWKLAGTTVHESFDSLLHPQHVADLASQAAHEVAGDARAAAKLLSASSDADTALRGPLSPGMRVAWSAPFPLARVKQTGHAMGATVNDVLVAAVSGALASYMERPDEVRAMVPVNLRALDSAASLGNEFALILLPLATTEATRVERLRLTKRTMDEIKRSREAAVAFGILALIGFTPPQVESRLIDLFSSKASLVLTNVPGPREPLHIAGNRLGGVLVWAPCSGSVGMSVTIFSYAGKVTVGFLTDAGLVPDPETIARAFTRELRGLAREVSDTAPRAARGSDRSRRPV
jgi:diacylglycerol O-acyltransferase / wax synthase